MSRLTEVEELAYLRWVNSCLRHELSNSEKLSREHLDIDDELRIKFKSTDGASVSDSEQCCIENSIPNSCTSEQVSTGRRLPNWPPANEDCQIIKCQAFLNKGWTEAQDGRSPQRRHSISGTNGSVENLTPNSRRQSDGFVYFKEMDSNKNHGKCKLIHQKYDLEVAMSPRILASKPESCKVAPVDIEKRARRIPNPPPRPSTSVSNAIKTNGSVPPPPPPPPPPPKFSTRSSGVMQRAPQVAELYHSLMKRESRKDSSGAGVCEAPNVASVRSSMIGEIENRSSHLLAVSY